MLFIQIDCKDIWHPDVLILFESLVDSSSFPYLKPWKLDLICGNRLFFCVEIKSHWSQRCLTQWHIVMISNVLIENSSILPNDCIDHKNTWPPHVFCVYFYETRSHKFINCWKNTSGGLLHINILKLSFPWNWTKIWNWCIEAPSWLKKSLLCSYFDRNKDLWTTIT